MNDTQLTGWMRSLPRQSASPAFTSEVMRAIRRTHPVERTVPRLWRIAAAFAVAACLVAAVQLAVMQNIERQRVSALRAEQQQLEAELQAVKRLARDSEPLVVLENDDGTRVIMDAESAVQPASMQHYD